MIDRKTNIKLMEISSNIFDICNDRYDMPNGDFQACLEAQVISAYLLGKKSNSLSQSSVDFINNLLDGEYNSTDIGNVFRDEIQDVQSELDLIEIKDEK
jgi:hypothetical protein